MGRRQPQLQSLPLPQPPPPQQQPPQAATAAAGLSVDSFSVTRPHLSDTRLSPKCPQPSRTCSSTTAKSRPNARCRSSSRCTMMVRPPPAARRRPAAPPPLLTGIPLTPAPRVRNVTAAARCAGELGADTMCWTEDLGDWTALGEVLAEVWAEGLTEAAAAAGGDGDAAAAAAVVVVVEPEPQYTEEEIAAWNAEQAALAGADEPAVEGAHELEEEAEYVEEEEEEEYEDDDGEVDEEQIEFWKTLMYKFKLAEVESGPVALSVLQVGHCLFVSTACSHCLFGRVPTAYLLCGLFGTAYLL